MAPNSTIHIIRHGQGYHQLANDEPDTKLHDPALTTHGIKECQGFCVEFPYHSQIDLVCASPLQRTIQTAGLAFQPETERGLKVIAVPDAQEGTDALSDTGSKKDFLKEKFGDLVDYNLLVGKWYEKTGDQAVDTKSLRERAKRLRIWLRSRKEENIVVVTHGFFAHFITGHIDEKGEQFGEYWTNVLWRYFSFADGDDEDAVLEEQKGSLEMHDRKKIGEGSTAKMEERGEVNGYGK